MHPSDDVPKGWPRRVLLVVLGFEAAGGLLGGALLIASPDGSLMKIPVADLQGAFSDFLIPGVLLASLGALNAVAFGVLLGRRASSWLWVGLALGGFAVWFVAELAMVGAKSWAQAAWGIPVLIGIAAALPLERRHLKARARLRVSAGGA